MFSFASERSLFCLHGYGRAAIGIPRLQRIVATEDQQRVLGRQRVEQVLQCRPK